MATRYKVVCDDLPEGAGTPFLNEEQAQQYADELNECFPMCGGHTVITVEVEE